MGIISEVKCGRCDRRYSGLRGRCPYCGARRGKRGKHANGSDNSKGKLVIGLLLILALLAAVVVLVVKSTNVQNPNNIEIGAAQKEDPKYDDDEDITTAGSAGTNIAPPTITPDNAAEDPNASNGDSTVPGTSIGADVSNGVSSNIDANRRVAIILWEEEKTDFTVNKGVSLSFSYVVEPKIEINEVVWASSDESVFTIDQNGNFYSTGSGTATMTLTIDGCAAECIVRVN